MASRILLRLIDEAIVPAIVVVVAKVGAVVFLVRWLDLGWHFNTETLLPSVVFENAEVGVWVNSYSNLFLYLVVLTGLIWVLVKAYHFHDRHVAPAFVLQLLSWNLTGLLASSEDIYHQGVIWISYLWLVTVLIAAHFLLGVTFGWILVVAGVLSLLATWLLIADVEREVENY